MKKLTERFIHYATLIAITAAAVWVMWKMSAQGQVAKSSTETEMRPLPAVAAPKQLVTVQPVQVEDCEIVETFSGKIRAWETYQVGFELGGRVDRLGENAGGAPLDEGDRVAQGQLLAVLDDRALRARRSEASAQVEQASSDLERAERSRRSSPNALTEAELQRFATDLALARAQLEVAIKNLEDATLRAPVAATISRRLVKPGETVGANEVVFQLVQDDRVLLVLNVPESNVRELQARMKQVRSEVALNPQLQLPSDRAFGAHVRLEGKDVFGKPWPLIEGEVFQIAQVADPVTSLFEVEVELPNQDRFLRPGMVATAQLVMDRARGYRIPSIAVIHRQNRAYLFTIEPVPTQMELMYWQVGEATLQRARRVDLSQWADQGAYVVAPAEEIQLSNVITRGQHRLADGQFVRIVDEDALLADQAITAAAGPRPSTRQPSIERQ